MISLYFSSIEVIDQETYLSHQKSLKEGKCPYKERAPFQFKLESSYLSSHSPASSQKNISKLPSRLKILIPNEMSKSLETVTSNFPSPFIRQVVSQENLSSMIKEEGAKEYISLIPAK